VRPIQPWRWGKRSHGFGWGGWKPDSLRGGSSGSTNISEGGARDDDAGTGGASDGVAGASIGDGGAGGEVRVSDMGGASGAGVTRPSCSGLAETCGPDGDHDCCSAALIPGGTFYRGYDGSAAYMSKAAPATVSDFPLDTYEVTVGRFRPFVAAYRRDMIAQGTGANPNNPSESGWDAVNWNYV
jgi:formylglycine-generating enzyme